MGLLLARLLVFSTSAAVLVMEIVAGRLMAPYVGVSLETFTGIIGVVLAGIAAGAWLGGVAADRAEPRALLGPLMVASGLLVMVSPTLVDLAGPSMLAGGPMEIVALTTIAFLLPSITLSAVPPVVVKLRLRSLDETGSVVGSLSAISTVGALVGTFLAGFVLLAAFPSRPMVVGMGAITLLAGVVLLLPRPGRGPMLGVAALTLVSTYTFGTASGPCDTQTSYFCASIEEDASRPAGRQLWLDTLLHSYVDLDDPTYLGLRYVRVIADVIGVQPEGPLDAVFLGGGGFTLPRYLIAERPGATAHVLEIDRALVDLVQDELGLVLSDDLTVTVADARLSLRRLEDDVADVVVGDAFGGLSVPWHLTTVEFVEEVDRVLAPGGVYVLNVIDYPPLEFVRADLATLKEVFPHVAVIAQQQALIGERGGNFILVASTEPYPWDALHERIVARGEGEAVWAEDVARAFAEGGLILRDDFAPVDQILGRP